MSRADAELSTGKHFENLNDVPNEEEAVIHTGDRLGFSIELLSQKTNLISIQSSLYGLRPGDAEQFDRDTLQQLGRPDLKVWRPTGSLRWVWVDGDVRVAYENTGSSSRIVSLTLVLFPEYLSATDKRGDEWEKKHDRREWGELPPTERKPLPDVWAGLHLGMSLAEVRSLIPDVEIYATPGNRERREKKFDNGNTIGLSFWRGQLYALTETRFQVDAERLEPFSTELFQKYGEPDFKLQLPDGEMLMWDDGRTWFNWSFHRESPASFQPPGPWTAANLGNHDIESHDVADEVPPKFKEGPAVKSFFHR